MLAGLDRVSKALLEQATYLTELDQAMGDGDTGLSLMKVAVALQAFCVSSSVADLGKFLAGAGLATNKAAPSTLGTLLSIAVMRMGKVVNSKTELSQADLVAMFNAADQAIQEKGKAKPGDKTIIDALHPASQAFEAALNGGVSMREAGTQALNAAQAGLDSVTPLRSKVGRASWVGERTEGKIDPGCAALVIILKALLNQ